MKKLTWFILGIAFVTALASLIFLISDTGAQSINDQRRKGDKDQEEISKLKSTFPVVQYDQSELVSPERKKKGAKYDVVPVIRPYIEDNSTEYIANEWAHDLSALPVEKSQAVRGAGARPPRGHPRRLDGSDERARHVERVRA